MAWFHPFVNNHENVWSLMTTGEDFIVAHEEDIIIF